MDELTKLKQEISDLRLEMHLIEDVQASAIQELREIIMVTRKQLDLQNNYTKETYAKRGTVRTNTVSKRNVRPVRKDSQDLPTFYQGEELLREGQGEL